MSQKQYVPLYEGPLESFPESNEYPAGVKVIRLQDQFSYQVDLLPNLEYAVRNEEHLFLQLLLPKKHNSTDSFPLVVFVQGSAWHRQDIFQHLQHMVRVCEHGYAVAMVQYRPSDIAPFPAQVQDVKTAIRFLRSRASEFSIDASRIGIWGDSSGAHTAVLVGITTDGELDTDLYKEQTAAVSCIVDWYGPTDISTMNETISIQDHVQPDSPEGFLIGRKHVLEHPELVYPTVPMHYLSRERDIPPILMMHGSKDQLVHFHQSCMLYEALQKLEKDVEFYKLEGAYHAFGGFNSDEALEIVIRFLDSRLSA